jgi:copper chaperone
MKTIELKTNIMCSSCVAKVTPNLNEAAGQQNWTVDIQNPEKILRVSGSEITEDEVISAVEKAGFRAVKRSA